MTLTINHFSEQLEYRKLNNISYNKAFMVSYLDYKKKNTFIEIVEKDFPKYDIIVVSFYPTVTLKPHIYSAQLKFKRFYDNATT